MTSKAEYDAAYFTLLRAIEERDDLMGYRELLHAERRRLDEFTAATGAADEALPTRLRRPLAQTAKPVLEAVGRRRGTVLEELRRIDDRVEAAEAFVRECEEALAGLRP